MAPVFSHGDLRLYLLSLLDESPRHGYDLMQALSDRTGGTYTPSAGTVYPRLANRVHHRHIGLTRPELRNGIGGRELLHF